MAEQVNIELILSTAESAKTLGDLKRSMGEVRKALDSVEVGSKAFKNLNEALDDGAERLRTFRRGFDGVKAVETFGKTISSSFGIASSAISQFADNNEELQKSLLKVQGALTLVQSFTQLSDAIKLAEEANLALNASLLTNPYVLVAAGIAAAVAAVVSFNDEVDKSALAIDGLVAAGRDLQQSFLNDKFGDQLSVFSDKFKEITSSDPKNISEFNSKISDLNDLLQNIKESSKSGELAITFADANTEISNINDQIGELQSLVNDVVNDPNSFNNFLQRSGKLAGDLNFEFKKTQTEANKAGEPIKAIEVLINKLKNDKKTYNEYLKIEKDINTEILKLEKEKATIISDNTDYLKEYNSLLNESTNYLKLLNDLGVSQNVILSEESTYLANQESLLNGVISTLTQKLSKVTEGTNQWKEYNEQITKATSELNKIQDRKVVIDLKTDLFKPIFGEADISYLKNEYQRVIDSIKVQIAKYRESIKGEPLVPFVGSKTQEQIDSAERSIEKLTNQLKEFQNQQDILSGRIQTNVNNIQNFFDVANLGETESIYGFKEFSKAFEANVINQVKQLRDNLSGRVFSEGIDNLISSMLDSVGGAGKQLAGEDLAAFIKIVKDIYNTYSTQIKSTKSSLDSLFKSGKINFEDYTKASEALISDSLGSLDQINAKVEATILKIADPQAKQAVLDFFKSLREGAATANGALSVIASAPTKANTILTDEQEKSRRAFDQIASGFGQQVSNLQSILQQASDQRIQILEDEKNKSLAILDDQYSKKLISEQQYQEKVDVINQEYRIKEKEEKKKQFAANKAASIIQAIINTALAVSSALTVAPPAGFILAGIAGVLGAAQIGIISSQPVPEYATGGYVSGPGGPKDDSINAKLSNGEYVINARSTDRFRPLLDAINYGYDGINRKLVETGKPSESTSPVTTVADREIKVVLLKSDLDRANRMQDDIRTRLQW